MGQLIYIKLRFVVVYVCGCVCVCVWVYVLQYYGVKALFNSHSASVYLLCYDGHWTLSSMPFHTCGSRTLRFISINRGELCIAVLWWRRIMWSKHCVLPSFECLLERNL